MIRSKSPLPSPTAFDSAERAQLRVRRLIQLAIIAGFGMLGIFSLLVAYTYSIHSRSANFENRLMNCRIAVQRALVGINLDVMTKLGDTADVTSTSESSQWLGDLENAANELLEMGNDSALKGYGNDLKISTQELRDWREKSSVWQAEELVVKAAATRQVAKLNAMVAQLKSDVEKEKGEERLHAVLAFRNGIAQHDELPQLSQLANQAIRASSSSHLEGDITSLQLSLLQLASETDASRLADCVQNQIRPRLLRLQSNVSNGNLQSLVANINDHLFRQTKSTSPEDSADEGLVVLQQKLARLQQKKRVLLKQVQDAIAVLNTEQETISRISLQLTERLGNRFVMAIVVVWTIIFLCATALSVIFWRLGQRVSTHICNQVKQLNAVATELSQEKVVLTVTQQRLERELQNHNVMQREREELFSELTLASRQAGMAEVATSVLHNVGNVLNSVNVSAHVVTEKLRGQRPKSLKQACRLIDEHRTDLGQFFHHDQRGQKLPEFLDRLADTMAKETQEAIDEMACLARHVDHIKQIVNTQQSFAKTTNLQEPLDLARLMEDAIKINDSALLRHEVTVIREFEDLPQVVTDRNKVLQIVVNLLKNAKQAVCQMNITEDRWIRLRIFAPDDQWVTIQVIDNGMGIAEQHMSRMFTHGFTTKKDGHGFGLHSSALTATELGGSLSVESEGTGKGATFTLQLPRCHEESTNPIDDSSDSIPQQATHEEIIGQGTDA